MTVNLTTGIILAYLSYLRPGEWLRQIFIMLLLSNIILPLTILAQQGFDRNISFQARNEKLTAVLARLAESEKLNLSYNPGEKSFDVPVSYNAVNKPLQTVLREILALSGHDYRLIGGQVVIFKTDTEPVEPVQRSETPQSAPSLIRQTESPIESPQPLPLRDTLILRDTILRVDTLIIRDTVIVEKEVHRTPKPERPATMREDLFRFEADRNNGWSVMPFYAHMVSFNRLTGNDASGELLNLTRDAESVSIINHAMGADVRFARKRWHITSGINYTRFAYRFRYNFEAFEGGFFRTDTIDVYYTIPQTDTVWFYVTDSTWIPLTSREYFYNRLNRHGYIEVPLTAGYNLYSDPNLRIWASTGFSFGIMTNKSGIAIKPSGEYAGIEFDELSFAPLVISYSLASGFRYKISEWMDVSGELFYRQQLNSLLREYPLDKKIGAIGLKAGLVFYL